MVFIMLYNRFTRIIENHADSLTKNWIKEIKSNSGTQNYAKLTDAELHNIVYDVYKKLGHWITKDEHLLKEICEYFVANARKLSKENFKLSEVIYATILARVELWKYLMSQGMISDAVDLNRAMDFSQRINYFFDKAIYFTTIGFETTHLNDDDLNEPDGFFDKLFESFKILLIKDATENLPDKI